MKHTPKVLYREFLLTTETYFEQHGFKLKIKDAIVEKIEGDCKQSIYFDPIWSPIHVSINPIFRFRLNQIQNVWGIFNDYMRDKDSYTSLFRMWDLYKIIDSGDAEFSPSIDDQIGLSIYIKNFNGFMDKHGWLFMSQLHSLTDYDSFLNHPNPMNDEFQNRVFHRRYASPGLIAAKLNQNPQYEFLYEKYLDILIGFNYVDAQAELKALKAYMDAHSIDELLSL